MTPLTRTSVQLAAALLANLQVPQWFSNDGGNLTHLAANFPHTNQFSMHCRAERRL
jgi:hypothetical protein